nr:hypothetical protein [Tanacetum cinerariifolium]
MEKNKIIQEDATDRISELPECIIENILLRLDKPKERVRVSVLSKKWFALTASVPVLKFLFSDFVDEEDWISSRDVRENFYKYVKYTVSRFCRQQNVKIAHTFKLLTVAGDKNEFYIIHDCVELILMRGVKVFDICVKKNRTSKCRLLYRLPNILSSVSTLTSLKISQCVVLPSSLMVGVVNFKSLKVLWLTSIPLDPLMIKHLTASCPLLEELVVDRQGRSATSVILGPCKQLRTLYLDGPLFLTSVGFSDFLSNFPVLENLSLCLVNRHNILAVSSPSLRNFVLYDECDPEEIDINTPNLRLFSYSNSGNCSKGEFDIKKRTHFLKCISKRLIQQDQGPTNILIEWSIPSKAKIYFSWSSMYTASTFHEMTQTITFRKEEGPDDGQKWRKKYERRRVKQVLD